MAIWQVIITLDTTIAAQNNALTSLRNAASQLKTFSQQQLNTTQWQVNMTLDDSQPTQAAILAAVYNNLATLTFANVIKIS